MKAIYNGTVIAESDKTIEVEGNQYFPPESVKQSYIENSELKTTCPWKGEASYYNVNVDGDKKENVGWYYPNPYKKAEELGIKNYVAFYNGVAVTK